MRYINPLTFTFTFSFVRHLYRFVCTAWWHRLYLKATLLYGVQRPPGRCSEDCTHQRTPSHVACGPCRRFVTPITTTSASWQPDGPDRPTAHESTRTTLAADQFNTARWSHGVDQRPARRPSPSPRTTQPYKQQQPRHVHSFWASYHIQRGAPIGKSRSATAPQFR